MQVVTRPNRAYFAAVGALALWVGFWGFLVPRHVDVALPFLVPPLHARFLGVMYLSGLVLQVAGLAAGRWAQIRIVPPVTAIWTGGLLIVSLLHLEAFDFWTRRVTIWFGAYFLYPLIALWLIWAHRDAWNERLSGPPLPRWVRWYLLAQGVVASAAGVALLFATDAMVEAWPWPITPLLAQIYFAPLLAYGIGSLLLARERTWPELRVGVSALLVFAVGVLIASLLHRNLFSLRQLSDVVWFAAFGAAALALALVGARSVLAERQLGEETAEP